MAIPVLTFLTHKLLSTTLNGGSLASLMIGALKVPLNRNIRAKPANFRGGASVGIANTSPFPTQTKANKFSSTSMAQWLTPPFG